MIQDLFAILVLIAHHQLMVLLVKYAQQEDTALQDLLRAVHALQAHSATPLEHQIPLTANNVPQVFSVLTVALRPLQAHVKLDTIVWVGLTHPCSL